jgi:phosphoribosylaminoimidazolecarboxamide formyltransferase/IMP cyclohydrolase
MERLDLNEYKELPFGENSQQRASISSIENGIEYDILSEKDLEYIDYLNLTRVLEILGEFFDVNAIAVAKNNILCTTALGSSLENAYEKVLESDPISITGSTFGFTKEVSIEIAKQLKAMGVKNVVSTRFSKEALSYLLEVSDLNIVQIKSPLQELLGRNNKEVQLTPFGYLLQDQNQSKLTKSSFKVAGKVKPTQQQAEDAIFAWKISKYVRTNCAVISKDLSTKAIIQGFSDGNFAVEKAIDIACENSKDAVLAIDGDVESEEMLNATVQGRIGLIIGYNFSEKFVKLADKYNLSIIKTGITNYRY